MVNLFSKKLELWQMLRRLIIVLTALFCGVFVSYSQTAEFSVPENLTGVTNLSNYISTYHDTSGKLNINDILGSNNERFSKPNDIQSEIQFPAVFWLKVDLANNTSTGHAALITFCHLADSITLFDTEKKRLNHSSSTGKKFNPKEKEIPSVNHNLTLSLPANTTKQIYARVIFKENVSSDHFAEMYLKSASETFSELMFKYVGQAFYSGLMLMFALFSVFTWFLFREQSFLYFSFVHLAFSLYFLTVTSSFEVLVFNVPQFLNYDASDFAITLLILALFNFISHFLRIQNKLPGYYRFFLIVTWITALNKYTHAPFLPRYEAVLINNLIILFWIIVTVIPIAILVKKRNSSAINLLYSIAILVITSVIYVLTLSRLIPSNFLTQHSIQIGSFIFSLFVFYRLFEIVKAIDSEKQKALSLNELKSKFFTNISHEFRTPLTLIIGPLKQMLEDDRELGEMKMMKTALKNANKLLNMVNQLLDLSRLENDNIKLDVQKTDLVSYLRGLFMSFESLAETKEIQTGFVSHKENIQVWVDTEKMEIIFYNLISNAFKYTPAGGKVEILIIDHENTVEVLVRDTGVGISAEKLPHIFDRFFRVENSGELTADGSGIGLSLAKELAELHNSSISVKSDVGVGTTFSIELIKGNQHFDPELLTKTSDESASSISTKIDHESIDYVLDDNNLILENNTPTPGTKPAILLVEDNADVREYIRAQLVDQFQVLEANNGLAGFELAVKHVPELIISDVMMPQMNGLELCKNLKQDVRTSHIPVILLTAKAEQEHKIEGLELGADDYLAKPFHAKELNTRVRNLIELRFQLRQRLLESPTLSFKSIEGNPVENRFLEQVSTCIDNFLADPQFGVDVLAEHVRLSSPQLNRKLKSITGLTANKYIQHVRLQKALIMLETENLNVSEVAFKTGFNSVAYFVKSFREHYGKTPGAILKQE
jgi:signal transduction histidine kinase/CheY-like chemotaxis protein